MPFAVKKDRGGFEVGQRTSVSRKGGPERRGGERGQVLGLEFPKSKGTIWMRGKSSRPPGKGRRRPDESSNWGKQSHQNTRR